MFVFKEKDHPIFDPIMHLGTLALKRDAYSSQKPGGQDNQNPKAKQETRQHQLIQRAACDDES